MTPDESSKRKNPPGQDGVTQARVKRVKVWEARQVRSEPSHKALNERKELDVGSFVKSHDFEIRALERSITTSKSALRQRAFQQVPRQLRRRTASHNVKKVPKRLRARATREMKEDKTPVQRKKVTGKQRLRVDIASSMQESTDEKPSASALANRIKEKAKQPVDVATAPVLIQKHKKRQSTKVWLPTHMFHAKRTHMTPPLKPLWGFAIPITPTEKAYRQTHRAFTLRGCVAWDMSYMSTIEVSGPEQSILKALAKLSAPCARVTAEILKWKQGRQTWTGFLFGHMDGNSPIAPVTIIWNPAEDHATVRQVLIRVHPAAFTELWAELRVVGSMQRPMLKTRDMRFEYGSIEMTGPAAMEAIVRTVRPMETHSDTFKNWNRLATITNIAALSQNLVIGVSMKDTRLNRASETLQQTPCGGAGDEFQEFISTWPPDSDRKPFALAKDQARKVAQQQKLTQKTIEKWKSASLGGENGGEVPKHHAIPAILYTLQRSHADGMSGSWILMLPWEHILPTWRSLMHTGLADGGQPRLGGLREQRLKAFESGSAWFPGDFPSSAAGWAWELREREQRMQDWAKRPKSKRVDFDSLDLGEVSRGELGRGWACDWEHLLGLEANDIELHEEESKKNIHGSTVSDKNTHQIAGPQSCFPNKPSPVRSNTLALVSITFCTRGNVSTCARIYRLPAEPEQRSAWLSLAPSKLVNDRQRPQRRRVDYGDSSAEDGSKEPMKTPAAEDLVGFVTSGNYKLSEGQATAIGSIHLQKVLDAGDLISSQGFIRGWCIIREAGGTIPRLARWKQQTYSNAMP